MEALNNNGELNLNSNSTSTTTRASPTINGNTIYENTNKLPSAPSSARGGGDEGKGVVAGKLVVGGVGGEPRSRSYAEVLSMKSSNSINSVYEDALDDPESARSINSVNTENDSYITAEENTDSDDTETELEVVNASLIVNLNESSILSCSNQTNNLSMNSLLPSNSEIQERKDFFEGNLIPVPRTPQTPASSSNANDSTRNLEDSELNLNESSFNSSLSFGQGHSDDDEEVSSACSGSAATTPNPSSLSFSSPYSHSSPQVSSLNNTGNTSLNVKNISSDDEEEEDDEEEDTETEEATPDHGRSLEERSGILVLHKDEEGLNKVEDKGVDLPNKEEDGLVNEDSKGGLPKTVSEMEEISIYANSKGELLYVDDGVDSSIRCIGKKKVYIVGTAHFSKESQMDVLKTIRILNPGMVILELCSQRKSLLTYDEEWILAEASKLDFKTMRAAIKQNGVMQGLLNVFLLSMSAQLTKQLGMAPGGEFRCAMKEAVKLGNGCVVVLGDRGLTTTLNRALDSLSTWQRLKLGFQFLYSGVFQEKITKEEVEKCKDRDLIESMMSELTGSYPGITRVFVHERDYYMAHFFRVNATHYLRNELLDHNKESHENRPVVAVVGMGHVKGISKLWGQTNEKDFELVCKMPEETLRSKVIRRCIKLSFYGLLGFGVYRLGRRFIK